MQGSRTGQMQPTDTAMDTAATPFPVMLDGVRQLARETAATHAADVDREARFPQETVDALRRVRALSAPVPRQYGGAGCTMAELTQLVSQLSQHCGASAMVLAMHYIQVGCITRHGKDDPYFQEVMRELVERQLLLGSMTSEVGTWGDTRSSICALKQADERFELQKAATTGSYCAQADGILVTTRRADDAAAGDQLLVLVRREDCTLTQMSTWDTLGMRGTCSPGFDLKASAHVQQVLPEGYPAISALTMVPYSHILWASLWWGLAFGAYAQAAAYVRSLARKSPGVVPPVATELAKLNVELQTMRYHWQGLAQEFDAQVAAGTDSEAFTRVDWALKMNNLKTACSEAAPRIVQGALQIVGIQGYKNDSAYSMGRAHRDAMSASLMISNGRIAARSASLLLVHKAD
ncbi:MAG: acyl-CoA dehydrogenase [Burkholderiales bacterium PBB6]|nr:MAG: acyl-CoA dehydrogenase [Burkholderiales bacterium PBB6]